jgi:hypothetical protein
MTEATTAPVTPVTPVTPAAPTTPTDALATPPTVPTPSEATVLLDARLTNPEFAAKLLAGSGPEVQEFHRLMALKSSDAPVAENGGDRLDRIIAGTEPAPPFETVVNGELTTRNQIATAQVLRDLGLSNGVIRQAFEGKPVSADEYNAVKNLRTARMSDKVWTAKLLAGDFEAKRELALMNIVMVAGYKEQAAS